MWAPAECKWVRWVLVQPKQTLTKAGLSCIGVRKGPCQTPWCRHSRFEVEPQMVWPCRSPSGQPRRHLSCAGAAVVAHRAVLEVGTATVYMSWRNRTRPVVSTTRGCRVDAIVADRAPIRPGVSTGGAAAEKIRRCGVAPTEFTASGCCQGCVCCLKRACACALEAPPRCAR